jgi:hypothetical protein
MIGLKGYGLLEIKMRSRFFILLQFPVANL